MQTEAQHTSTLTLSSPLPAPEMALPTVCNFSHLDWSNQDMPVPYLLLISVNTDCHSCQSWQQAVWLGAVKGSQVIASLMVTWRKEKLLLQQVQKGQFSTGWADLSYIIFLSLTCSSSQNVSDFNHTHDQLCTGTKWGLSLPCNPN